MALFYTMINTNNSKTSCNVLPDSRLAHTASNSKWLCFVKKHNPIASETLTGLFRIAQPTLQKLPDYIVARVIEEIVKANDKP